MLEKNNIYLGDCLELMKQIPDKSVDMILCDLPYGTTACAWDSIIPLDKLWEQYERIIKVNGAIVLTANAKFTMVLGASNIKLYRYKWVWEKTIATRFLQANKMPLAIHEDILVFYKKLPTYNPQMTPGDPYTATRKSLGQNQTWNKNLPLQTTVSSGERFPTDIIKIGHEKNRIHETQKPVELFEYLIKTYSNPGDLILDNCSGSGTTAIACLNTDRRFICMEKDPTHYENSIKRTIEHAKNLVKTI